MAVFGLTGGMGSGKTAVTQRLAPLGAAIVDADATVKALQAPGEPVFVAMVGQFGERIVGGDGQLNRAEVARIAFSDPTQLKALNAIVHPAVKQSMWNQRMDLAKTHLVVVLDIPLLVEGLTAYPDLAGVVVVDVPTEIAIRRLVELRGFTAPEAKARLAAQATRSQRLVAADFVIDNSKSLGDLEDSVGRCWRWMQLVAVEQANSGNGMWSSHRDDGQIQIHE